MTKIEIYTDGSCNQAEKKGGWAFLIMEDEQVKYKGSGREVDVTNNRCEMLAIINACELLDGREYFEVPHITVFSDSAYIVNAFSCEWISKWLANGWKTSEGTPVINKDLWETMIYYQQKYTLNFQYIKRRSNNHAKMVDDMAKEVTL